MEALKLLKWILSIPKFEKEIHGFVSAPLLKSIFCENFINSACLTNSDDLIFFIFNHNNQQTSETSSLSVSTQRLNAIFGLIHSKPKIRVYRQSSPNLPIENPSIDWYSTMSLNLLLQKFTFQIQVSICTQTSSKHYQILSKHIIPVHPSPSRHSVICKEISEEYSYPEINFSVDNFDEYLHGIVIGGLETVYIELIAFSSSSSSSSSIPFNNDCSKQTHQNKNDDNDGNNKHEKYCQHRVFSTAIHYETLFESCSKKNAVKRHGQTFGLLRALDPAGSGTRTELIIKKKIKRSLSDSASFFEKPSRTITTELPTSEDELLEEATNNDQKQNSLALEFFFLNRIRNRVKLFTNQQRQGLTIGLEDLFHCNDIQLEKLTDDPWKQRGFEQSLSQYRSALKINPEPLNICVTRIALPIHSILETIITS